MRNLFDHLMVGALLAISTTLWAGQPSFQLPPSPYGAAPAEIMDAQTVAAFPARTFLECVVLDEAGTAFVTQHHEGRLYRVTGKNTEMVAEVPGKLTCLAPHGKGFIAVGV